MRDMSNQHVDLFVGCYGSKENKTIHWLEFDSTNETIREVASFHGVENPSYLTVNSKSNRLYAISEVDKGEVISFAIDHDRKEIHELNRQFTNGAPCYLELGIDDRYLFTANYGGGSIIVHPISENGEIGEMTDWKTYRSAGDGQAISKLHTIRNIPQTKFYVATDLGLNKLYFYRFSEDSGQLTQLNEVDMPEGSGPRHLAFHPYLNRLYVMNEFNSTILAYSYDNQLESVQLEQVLPTLPDDYSGENYGADIHITSSGRYVYVSNRGHHSIAAYETMQDGKLKMISYTPALGQWPRNFTILPNSNYILVANEHSNNIVVMKRLKNGRLQGTNTSYAVDKPVCVQAISLFRKRSMVARP